MTFGYVAGVPVWIAVLALGIIVCICCINWERETTPSRKRKLTDTVPHYVINYRLKFDFTDIHTYKLTQDLSNKYDPRIRQLYEYDGKFAQNLMGYALKYVLTSDEGCLDGNGKVCKLFNHLKNSDVMNNIFSEWVEGGIITAMVEYLRDVKSILNLNQVYCGVPMGNVETPTYILHDNIDLLTSDKIIRIIFDKQSSDGRDIYNQGFYARLYIWSHYTNKEINYSSKNMDLCVLNLLTNEFVVYDKVKLELV